MMEKKLY